MERDIYDEDHEAFRDVVKEFCKRYVTNAAREKWDADGQIDRETLRAADLDGVEVAHQHHRRIRVVPAELRDRLQHPAQPGAARDRALGTALDGRAVGHRIGERHAELDHVGAGRDQRVHRRHGRLQRGIAGGQERDQRLAAGGLQLLELGVDAVHG